jgi:hypothetical protein
MAPCLQTWTVEQRHETSPYRYGAQLSNGGKGGPVGFTGQSAGGPAQPSPRDGL